MKWRWAALILCAALLAGCSASKETVESSSSFFAMDTYMSITAYGEGAEEGVERARTRILELDGLWSVTDEGSDIYALNHSRGQGTAVSADTASLLEFAADMSNRTGGALNIAIYPVLRAWGFTGDAYRVPSRDEIQELLPLTRGSIAIAGDAVTLDAGMMIDLGAVGKGRAGDAAADILRDCGVASALLDLGGNIQAVGARPDGGPWRLGILDPDGAGNVGVLRVADAAVVTSGSYERYFTAEDGTRYGHIIDPDTGCPVDNELLSVTVIAREGALCDALSTSLFVMGLDEAIEHWRRYGDFDMVIITRDGEIFLTEGIRDSFTLDAEHGHMAVNVIGR